MPTGRKQSALRELLAAAIDYAGLFPPAKLAMDPAIRNYVQYRGTPESWMLGRFICPTARLEELSPFILELIPPQQPLVISALGRGGANRVQFLEQLKLDLADIAAFRHRHGERVVVDAFETKLPTDVIRPDGSQAVTELAAAAAEQIEQDGPPTLLPFLEAGVDEDWRANLKAVGEGLYRDAEAAEGRDRCSPFGLKLRTGGLEAAAFPSCEQIAYVMTLCRQYELALKFTAGLHHPVRTWHDSVQTQMHGFMNVLLAALFAYAAHWPEAELAALLKEEDPKQFHVHEEGIGWRTHALDAAAIHRLRQEEGLSFGSCSFDEPRDDLKTFGWM